MLNRVNDSRGENVTSHRMELQASGKLLEGHTLTGSNANQKNSLLKMTHFHRFCTVVFVGEAQRFSEVGDLPRKRQRAAWLRGTLLCHSIKKPPLVVTGYPSASARPKATLSPRGTFAVIIRQILDGVKGNRAILYESGVIFYLSDVELA